MKKNNILIAGIFTLALVTGAAFGIQSLSAHGWGGPGYGHSYGYHYGPMHGNMGYGNIEFMREELGLTDSQVKDLARITDEFRKNRFENRRDYEKSAQLWVEHRKAIEKILTKEQRDKLEKINETYGWHRGCAYGY